jgi:hypothetical protein
LRQIRHVEPLARQDVTLAKRFDVTSVGRIEPLVEVDVDFEVHVLQTSIALAVHARVDAPLDREHPIGLAELEVNPNRFREDHPFKRLDSYLILDHHQLAAAG